MQLALWYFCSLSLPRFPIGSSRFKFLANLIQLFSRRFFVKGNDGDSVNKMVTGVPMRRTRFADFCEKFQTFFSRPEKRDPAPFREQEQVVEVVEDLVRRLVDGAHHSRALSRK